MSRSPTPLPRHKDLWWAYRLRWKRRDYLWRAFRARRSLTRLAYRTAEIAPGDILCVATLRNEAIRLPGFLDHYRALGVSHFLMVVNDSDDGSAEMLADQPDVSVWTTRASYRDSRFGLDWSNWLLARYGRDHWCLTVDADELLIYPHWQDRGLPVLTAHLDRIGQPAMGALMLDLYPKGSMDQAETDDPLAGLDWFDPGPYRTQIQHPKWNRWVQGGPRDRMFFADRPEKAPTLNKLPLVRWQRHYAYSNSTHAILPRDLNTVYDGPGDPRLSGVLLHTKFMPGAAARAAEEKRRGQHFSEAASYDAYYDALSLAPDLWHPGSVRLTGWQQLVDLGLMSDGGWSAGSSQGGESN
ncbi:glycosyltransferase family 2 protein [Paracoccus zhejiangensis]|uniref:Glycosyl transferase family 2 n=1 Tax=Paracoccus zhejiangensis TaxID=1077935 RepID=A0A2H5F1D0_9RHOB|nr:glycosyltransferase family 2 protein [Paracoccus zhejiangensis]AUH65343.1 glycosyl transferase family 2 [Paracoccus zhejiangensis]